MGYPICKYDGVGMKRKLKYFCLCALAASVLMVIAACQQVPAYVDDKQVFDDLENHIISRTGLDLKIQDFEVHEHVLDDSSKKNFVSTSCIASNKQVKVSSSYMLEYSLSKDGWNLIRINSDSGGEFFFEPLEGPSQETADEILFKRYNNARYLRSEYDLTHFSASFVYEIIHSYPYAKEVKEAHLNFSFDNKAAIWVQKDITFGQADLIWEVDGKWVYYEEYDEPGWFPIRRVIDCMLNIESFDGEELVAQYWVRSTSGGQSKYNYADGGTYALSAGSNYMLRVDGGGNYHPGYGFYINKDVGVMVALGSVASIRDCKKVE